MGNVNANATQSMEMWYNQNSKALSQDKSPDWNMCLYSGLVKPPDPSISNQLCIPSYSALAQHFVQPENLNLLSGQDQFFGAAGQAITYAPPLPPTGAIPAMVLRTHLDWRNPNLQDTFFGVNGEPPTYQPPPNPLIAIPTIELRTWMQATPLNLRSLDTMYGTAGEVSTYTWVTPLGYVFPIALRTFLSELKQNLLGQDTILGVAGQPLPHIEFRNPQIIAYPFEHSGALIDEPPALVIIVPPPVVPPPVVTPPAAVVVVPGKDVNEVELGYALIRRFLEMLRDH